VGLSSLTAIGGAKSELARIRSCRPKLCDQISKLVVFYPLSSSRSLARNTANKWSQQIAHDAAVNIMKEFWPDVRYEVLHQ
jgi:hypothetical protein